MISCLPSTSPTMCAQTSTRMASGLLICLMSTLLPHLCTASNPSNPSSPSSESCQTFPYNLLSPWTWIEPFSGQNTAFKMSEQTYSLPKLPYAYDALEPHISKQIMELHHSKHHNTYVTNLNAALANQATASQNKDIPQQVANLQAIKFNGGGHINHSLFWQNLTPANSKQADFQTSAPRLGKAIEQQYGSYEAFVDKFGKALLGIQGSGWGWLVRGVDDGGKLSIVTTKDQDPVAANEIPVFGVDMWEHAYYLQYLNGKAEYVKNIWNIINWETAESRYAGGRADAFKVLKASM